MTMTATAMVSMNSSEPATPTAMMTPVSAYLGTGVMKTTLICGKEMEYGILVEMMMGRL